MARDEALIENVGPGWADLVRDAIAYVRRAGGHVVEVKEKWGELTIYTDNTETEPVYDYLDELARRSRRICETCGAEARQRSYGGWIVTACSEHAPNG